jgi:hypothetical protein
MQATRFCGVNKMFIISRSCVGNLTFYLWYRSLSSCVRLSSRHGMALLKLMFMDSVLHVLFPP